MAVLIFLTAFGASVIGAVCGIGGGVIIKPLMDTMAVSTVAEISFLSGCTVLSMSCYSVCKALFARDCLVKFETGTPLAAGAAVGGILGKTLFSLLQKAAVYPQRVGGYQAICLAVVTAASLIYTIKKSKITTLRISSVPLCVGIGLSLGVLSSFLGIGGGPINLVVLSFFFSMDTKEAAQNSLYCILISQAASLASSILTNSIPAFHLQWLIVMILGGIVGGMAGRAVNRRMSSQWVNKMYVIFLVVIVGICCYNAWRFLGP